MIKKFMSYMKNVFIAILLSILIFPSYMLLINVKASDILYCILLYLTCTLLYILYRFVHFSNQYTFLDNLSNHISTNQSQLPSYQNPMEEKYTEIINDLYNKIKAQLSEVDTMYTEQLEYYTLWVHQIKTPIAAIRLTIESMEDENQKSILSQELFKIEQYVELALQYVKLNALDSDLVIDQYNLDTIVKHSVRKYAMLFINKGLSVDISNCNHMIITDSKWFSFILEQLFSNAIKYTNHGTIIITTALIEENLVLTIRDSGIGIRKEDIKRIFEKGYTGFNGRMDKKASGIGLYLVKKVCTALNHEIRIDSVVGEGTTVMLTIKNNL